MPNLYSKVQLQQFIWFFGVAFFRDAGAEEAHQNLGVSLKKTTLSFLNGNGSGKLLGGCLFSGMSSNFFHGDNARKYMYNSVAVDRQLSEGLAAQFGAVTLTTPGVSDRTVYYSGFTTSRLSGTVMAVNRGEEIAGRGLDLAYQSDAFSIGYRELRSSSDVSWRQASIHFDLNKAVSLGLRLTHADNPLYKDIDETRLMAFYRIDFDKKSRFTSKTGKTSSLIAARTRFNRLSRTGEGAAVSGSHP